MFVPKNEHYADRPTPGFFYRVKSGDMPIRIASAAYGDANKRTGLFSMNNSSWNDHVSKGPRGWEVYRVQGLQLNPSYDPDDATSRAGSGRSFPVLWIPRDGKEPSDIYKPAPRPVSPVKPHKPAAPRPVSPVKPHKPAAPRPVSPVAPFPGRYMKGRFLPVRGTSHFSERPKPGAFYQVKKGDTCIGIASDAYGSGARRAGLYMVNLSTWNDHVRRDEKSWEAYGMKGLQLEARFAPSEPRSYWDTGNAFPVLWIPPGDFGRVVEPEEYFADKKKHDDKKHDKKKHDKKKHDDKKHDKKKHDKKKHDDKKPEAKKKPDVLGLLMGGLTLVGIAKASGA